MKTKDNNVRQCTPAHTSAQQRTILRDKDAYGVYRYRHQESDITGCGDRSGSYRMGT